MNTIQALAAQPLFQVLGWTLLHFVWQGALAGVLFAGANVLLRPRSANTRYAAACCTMLLMLVLPLATFYMVSASSVGELADDHAQERASDGLVRARNVAALTHREVNAPAQVYPEMVLPPEAMRSETWAEGSFAYLLPWLVVGYELPQVLMLSASRLNADYLEDLVRMLKNRNYSFVSLDAALKDRAYGQPDEYTGPVGISWLQRWAITKGMGFRKEPPLPPFMRQFDKRSASASDFKTE
jgi:hypothetical protein